MLAPEYFPWRIEPLGLVVDFALWPAVAFLVLRAYTDYDPGSGEAS